MKQNIKRLRPRQPDTDTLLLTIQDGVISGKCIMTTFGNTMRNIIQQKYLMYMAGITDYRIHAAGDDCVIFCEADKAIRIKETIIQHSHRVATKGGQIGFGNVYSDVSVNDIDGYDFCSKVVYEGEDGSITNMSREIKKALTTK